MERSCKVRLWRAPLTPVVAAGDQALATVLSLQRNQRVEATLRGGFCQPSRQLDPGLGLLAQLLVGIDPMGIAVVVTVPTIWAKIRSKR